MSLNSYAARPRSCDEYGVWCGGPWSCPAEEGEFGQCQAYIELKDSWVDLAAGNTDEGTREIPAVARTVYPKSREGPWLPRVSPAVDFSQEVSSLLAKPCQGCKLQLLECRCLPSACPSCRLTLCVCQPSAKYPGICPTCLDFTDKCCCSCQCRAANHTTCTCLFKPTGWAGPERSG